MSKDQMFAKVILASKPTTGALPIYTMHLHYPRIIHGEIMTHRVFSRNARSSRAVPVYTMLREIREIPFVPWHWGKNQKGMQASEECNTPVTLDVSNVVICDYTREEAWLKARDSTVAHAEAFMNAGYHKQVVNRLIEPYSWIDTLITSTQWANFDHLRDHPDAEPHFRDLAQMVKEARAGTVMQTLEPGKWHLPYISDKDYWALRKAYVRPEVSMRELCAVSAARCARISYAPFDGDPSYQKEMERYRMLISGGAVHASPLEHQAQADSRSYYERTEVYPGGKECLIESDYNWDNPELSGNLSPGWIQFRKTIDGEAIPD